MSKKAVVVAKSMSGMYGQGKPIVKDPIKVGDRTAS